MHPHAPRSRLAVGVLVLSVGAEAAIRVTVTPLEGTPTTTFTVSFVVDRELSGDRWLAVRVQSPVRRTDCENHESASVSFAPRGRRVNVVGMRPAGPTVARFRFTVTP